MPFRDLIVGGLLVLGVVAGIVACASRAGDAIGTGGAAARNGAGGAAVTTGGAAGSPAASVTAGGTSPASGGTAAFDLCPPGLVGAKSSATGGVPATLSGCGDGILSYKFEGCDDGNLQSGDGCSSTCTIEPGWTCDRPGQPCRLPTCGNGLIETPETCDDFNTIGGDGCSAQCTVENGWTCEHSGLVVPNCYHARCGDGRVNSLPYVDALGDRCRKPVTTATRSRATVARRTAPWNPAMIVHNSGLRVWHCAATLSLKPSEHRADHGSRNATTATFRRVTAARPTASWSPAGNAAFQQSRVGECDSLLEETRANWANHMSKSSADGT